jgi:hypothetical protein
VSGTAFFGGPFFNGFFFESAPPPTFSDPSPNRYVANDTRRIGDRVADGPARRLGISSAGSGKRRLGRSIAIEK